MEFFGVRETSPNRSPIIDQWQKPFGLRGQNWCMMFQWNMEERSARKHGYKNPLAKTALCCQQLAYARRVASKLKVVYCGVAVSPKVQTGWLGITSKNGTSRELIGKQWSGHVFRVRQDLGDVVLTVEGNCKNMVTSRIFKKSKTLAFIAPL